MNAFGVAPEPDEVDELVGLGRASGVRVGGSAGSPSTVAASEVRSWAFERDRDRLPNGEVGEEVGLLERAAESAPARARRRRWEMSSPRSSIRPRLGTKPLIAFMSVDLPAPFAPMSPTTAPRSSAMLTSSTAAMPAEVHREVLDAECAGVASPTGARSRRGTVRARHGRSARAGPVAAAARESAARAGDDGQEPVADDVHDPDRVLRGST